jgi:diguanylate cyclase (GGDEF)-like protein
VSGLFDFSGLTPHGFCLAWEPGLIWLTAISDLLIAAAYFSIPAALIAFLLRRRGFGYTPLVVLFAAFILACGATHVFDAMTLWVPAYWWSATLDALTAALSVATAIVLWPLIPRIAAIPSPRALQQANLRLHEAETATARANHWLTMSEQVAHVGHWRQTAMSGPMIWSDELFRIFGLESTDGQMTNDQVRGLWHPDDRHIVRLAAAKAFRDRTSFDADARAVRPDGEIRHVRVRGMVQMEPDGGAASMFGICGDRTEQALIERDLELARSEAEASRQLVEQLALQDSLTGLANRRHFDMALDGEFRRARRMGGSFALIMIDVDHFKQFNDRYGHPAGDACLKAVGGALPGLLRRPGDLVARYGGEEFAAILPAADLMAAGRFAERIVHAVRDLGIEHADSLRGLVTVSAGVAAMVPAPGDEAALPLLKEADRALYLAKVNGRDQVRASPEDLLRCGAG